MRKYLTITRLFELVIVLGIFVLAARSVGDPDFWWHLRTGQHIVETQSIPYADIYSHTNPGKPWIAHEWLSEVVIYGVYRSVGWLGLIVAFGACITAAFWIVFRRSDGGPYVAGVATLWGAIATIPFWGVRPQMFSLLLASMFLYLLDRHRESRNTAVLWWIPPLVVIWVNVHGGYALGLAIVGVAALAELVDAVVMPHKRHESLHAARALAVVLVACFAAALINPNGYRMFLYPLETLSSPSQQSLIYEWASPDFHLPRMQAFAALLIGSFVLMIVSGKRAPTRDLLLLVLTGYAALRSSRHIPLFVLVAVPVVAASLKALLEVHGWKLVSRQDWATLPTRKAVLHATLALVLVGAGATRALQVANSQKAFETSELPTSAVTFIKQQHPPGPIFHSYEWGGYLIWQLYPEYRVFIDGRADLYGDAFLEEFVRTYKAENDWRNVLRKFDVNTVVLPPEAPLAVLLQEEPSWRTVFSDNQAVICVRRDPQSTAPDTTALAQQ
ncbi:MAG TPA: hypothetical protein VD837_06595 [Terriglobales bacterium]|nr:hypothetical protein [Terriglobales bacterium]